MGQTSHARPLKTHVYARGTVSRVLSLPAGASTRRPRRSALRAVLPTTGAIPAPTSPSSGMTRSRPAPISWRTRRSAGRSRASSGRCSTRARSSARAGVQRRAPHQDAEGPAQGEVQRPRRERRQLHRAGGRGDLVRRRARGVGRLRVCEGAICSVHVPDRENGPAPRARCPGCRVCRTSETVVSGRAGVRDLIGHFEAGFEPGYCLSKPNRGPITAVMAIERRPHRGGGAGRAEDRRGAAPRTRSRPPSPTPSPTVTTAARQRHRRLGPVQRSRSASSPDLLQGVPAEADRSLAGLRRTLQGMPGAPTSTPPSTASGASSPSSPYEAWR